MHGLGSVASPGFVTAIAYFPFKLFFFGQVGSGGGGVWVGVQGSLSNHTFPSFCEACLKNKIWCHSRKYWKHVRLNVKEDMFTFLNFEAFHPAKGDDLHHHDSF